MTVLRSIALFVVAAVAEIGGAWLIWQGVREHRGLWWIGAGGVALGAYGVGAPLRSWWLVRAASRGRITAPGWTVEAAVQSDSYQAGWKVTDARMRTLNLEPHAICPDWSYTLRTRQLAYT